MNLPAETVQTGSRWDWEGPRLLATFRDPAGRLQLTGSYALRRVYPSAEADVREFLDSRLRADLERSGDLIPTAIADPDRHSSVGSGEFWLEHPRIAPISYPWEWTPVQWRAAAALMLRIAAQAVVAGWMLKDATPLNILFDGARPILVDALSFERRNPRSSLWLAYGQFVRTFLLPLVAAKYLSWPLEATQFWRDGIEPMTLYRALPRWRRLNPRLLDVVTAPALLHGPVSDRKMVRALRRTANADLATYILRRRIARLAKQIEWAAPMPKHSQWSEYAQSASHYAAADLEAKQRFVQGVLDKLRPLRVLDIGSNTGTYSVLAAMSGARVTALESDHAAAAILWRTAADRNLPITVLATNIARPTPAAGWDNREHLSLLARLTGVGASDLVLMLAVIHHLILREQVPLSLIAELCAALTRRWLVLEWVPPSDPMFREWVRGRDKLYSHLSEDGLLAAFARYFHLSHRETLGNGRVLFLFVRPPREPF